MEKIAGEEELRAFRTSPEAERKLNEPLKGVLKEVALTGVIRYEWSLLRPLLSTLLKEVLDDFHAEAVSEIGPARPLLEGETLQQVADRFVGYLLVFKDAPWTAQRLCEVLLEPHKQYSRLHKVVMAIEKLLLVTGEVPVDPTPPPLPALSSLGPVNDNPPALHGVGGSAADGTRNRLRAEEDSARITASMLTIKPDPAPQGGAEGPTAMDIDGPPLHLSIKPTGPLHGGVAGAVKVELGLARSEIKQGGARGAAPEVKSNGRVHIGPGPGNAEAGGRQLSG